MKNNFHFSLLLLCCFQVGFGQIPNYVPTNGLVAWYPFNENANDESGNGYNGTVSNVNLTIDRFDMSNSAYEWGSGYISTTINVSPDVMQQTSWSAWIRPTSNMPAGGFVLSADNNQNYTRAIFMSSAKLYVMVGSQSWEALTLTLNTWQHIVVTFDTDNVYAYKNTQKFTYGQAPVPNTTNQPLWIGSSPWDEPFSGKIDDIGIWNRPLTDAEIIRLYQSCTFSILNQPANATYNLGETALFTVEVSGINPLFQWQTNIGSGFENVSNTDQYSGADSANLTISNLSQTNNNQQFRCILNYGTCSDTTDVVNLIVNLVSSSLNLSDKTKFELYPNPASNEFTINISDNLIGRSFELLNYIGSSCKTGRFVQNQTRIDVSKMNGGFYFLRINETEIKPLKIVIK